MRCISRIAASHAYDLIADANEHRAREAGEILISLREEMFANGESFYDIKDAGDAAAQKYIAEQLHTHRPDDAVLSE